MQAGGSNSSEGLCSAKLSLDSDSTKRLSVLMMALHATPKAIHRQQPLKVITIS